MRFLSVTSDFFFFWLHHMACGIVVPWPVIKPASPVVEAWSLNHWTTREVPQWPQFCMNITGISKMTVWFDLIWFDFYLFIYFWAHCAACGISVPQPGIKPAPPIVEARSLNHWTAREVQDDSFKIHTLVAERAADTMPKQRLMKLLVRLVSIAYLLGLSTTYTLLCWLIFLYPLYNDGQIFTRWKSFIFSTTNIYCFYCKKKKTA